jgi:hypothetical protein
MFAAAHTISDDILRRVRRGNLGSFGAANARPRNKQKSSAAGLSSEARSKVERAIRHAWADSTLQKYGQSLEAFHHFCSKEGISAEQRLPANEFLLCAFAASRVGEIAGSTARGAIAAVKAWHIIHDEEWQGGIRLRYTLRGVENLAPSKSKKDARPPITTDMLSLIVCECFSAICFSLE